MSDYEIADRKDSRALTEFLRKEGQFLLPIVSLIETAQGAIDEVIDVAGRATIEALLQLSAQEVAGEKHPGKAPCVIPWHGQQSRVVPLSGQVCRRGKRWFSNVYGSLPSHVVLRGFVCFCNCLSPATYIGDGPGERQSSGAADPRAALAAFPGSPYRRRPPAPANTQFRSLLRASQPPYLM
jgi:hypothetical protein